MPRKKMFSSEQEQEICRIYRTGTKTLHLAEQYNCNASTIRNILHAHNVPLRQGRELTRAGRQRISQAAKQQWVNGKVPPMLGKRHSQETKDKISAAQLGNKNYNWKGGRKRVKKGNQYYIYRLVPNHPSVKNKTTNYIAEHRLVMEKYLGRILKPWEEVHHRNGIKDDNRLENLELVVHTNHHGWVQCPCCQEKFKIK